MLSGTALPTLPWRCETEEHRAALERLFRRIAQANALPKIGMRVIELAESESTRVEQLQRAIASDSALVTRMLRRVNSAYYGLRRKIYDVATAVRILGFREVRNLALTVYTSRLFSDTCEFGRYSRRNLWAHSVSVAALSRMVSSICKRAEPHDAYAAGLLHDVGYILLDRNLHRHFCRLLESLSPGEEATEIEREIFSFDHTELGSFVAADRSFSQQVVDAILFHHRPHEYDGPHCETVFAVALANCLCSRNGRKSLGENHIPNPTDEIYQGLDVDEADLQIIWDELDPTMAKAEEMARG